MWGWSSCACCCPRLPASHFSLLNIHLMPAGKSIRADATPHPAPIAAAPEIPAAPQTPAAVAPPQTGIIVRIAHMLPPDMTPAAPAVTVAAPLETIIKSPPVKWWPFVVAAVWLLGCAILLARLIAANIAAGAAQACWHATPVSDPAILGLLRECCGEMHILHRPTILITEVVRAPAAAGVWRPRILLPDGLFDTLSLAEQRAILLHELAHLRSRDIAVSWLLAILHIIHWFNPMLWLAFARMKADREGARDAMVLSLICRLEGRDASSRYSQTLLKLIERIAPQPSTLLAATTLAGMVDGTNHPLAAGFFGNRRGLKRRLDMIARFPRGSGRLNWTGPRAIRVAGGLHADRGAKCSARHAAGG